MVHVNLTIGLLSGAHWFGKTSLPVSSRDLPVFALTVLRHMDAGDLN